MVRRRTPRDGKEDGGLLEVLESGDPPAFVTDDDDRIVLWNRGAEEIFGKTAGEVMGKSCYEVVQGRDLHGNHFCYQDCPIVAQRRLGEPASGCEVVVPGGDGETRTVSVTIVLLPANATSSPLSVHLLRPLDQSGPLAELLERAQAESRRLGRRALADPVPSLTVRESEILGWVAAGLQNKEVAHKLEISLATVRNHIHNILDKLQVHSKLEAVSLAFRKGWVSGAPTVLPPHVTTLSEVVSPGEWDGRGNGGYGQTPAAVDASLGRASRADWPTR
jgi:PAS domain S-box-containing protein